MPSGHTREEAREGTQYGDGYQLQVLLEHCCGKAAGQERRLEIHRQARAGRACLPYSMRGQVRALVPSLLRCSCNGLGSSACGCYAV